MSDYEDDTFEQSGSGASLTYPKQCSALRKNEFVMIKGKACKIVDMSTSKTGKHGHAKVHMVALDIFDGRKYEDICPSTHNMECPIVKRTEYQLIDIDDEGFCTLMDDTGETRDDLKSHDAEIEKQIREKIDAGEDALVCVLKAIGQEMIMSMKNMAK
jgi:translation initiation factor 5A